MSNSIYGIANWSSGATYNRFDIVKHGGKFWYSTVDSNTNNTPSTSSTQWDGNKAFAGKDRPEFLWTPSYNPVVTAQPDTTAIMFGDGYEQRTENNLHADRIVIEVNFEQRNKAEATAILHFLHARVAKEAFTWIPPDPYSSEKLFICRGWSHTQPFFNQYNIRAVFEEVVN